MSAGLTVPAGLFAQLRFDLEFVILCILLIALIVAGCIAVARVRRWSYEESQPPVPEDQIANYHELVERGDMDPQEFERIKALLEKKTAEPPPPETPM